MGRRFMERVGYVNGIGALPAHSCAERWKAADSRKISRAARPHPERRSRRCGWPDLRPLHTVASDEGETYTEVRGPIAATRP